MVETFAGNSVIEKNIRATWYPTKLLERAPDAPTRLCAFCTHSIGMQTVTRLVICGHEFVSVTLLCCKRCSIDGVRTELAVTNHCACGRLQSHGGLCFWRRQQRRRLPQKESRSEERRVGKECRSR